MYNIKKAKVISNPDIKKFNESLQNYIDQCTKEGLRVIVSKPETIVVGNYSGGGQIMIYTRALVTAYL